MFNYWRKKYYRLLSSLSTLERKVKKTENNLKVVTVAYKKAKERGRKCEELEGRCKKLTRQRDLLHQCFVPLEDTGMDVFVVLNEIESERLK